MRTTFLFALLCAVGLSACAPGPAESVKPQPQETVARLSDAIRRAGFIPLKIPRTDFDPGTIVEIIEQPDGSATIERYSDMSTCGATAQELQTAPGTSVSFGSNRELRLGLGGGLNLGSARLAPSADYVNGAKIQVGQTATPSLDRIRVDQWRERITGGYDGLGLPAICREIAQDTPRSLYIVYEALALENGTITYDIKSGAKAQFQSEVASVASAEGGVGYDGDASVTFAGPIYFGVKRLQYLNGRQQSGVAAATAAATDAQGDVAAAAPPSPQNGQLPAVTRSIGAGAPPGPEADLTTEDLEALVGEAI